MPCEYCAADAGSCCVCQDTVELLTPRHLYDVALGSGFTGATLARSIAEVQAEYGPLSADQLEAFVQGWQEGSQDAAAYRDDMRNQPTIPPEDRAAIPF